MTNRAAILAAALTVRLPARRRRRVELPQRAATPGEMVILNLIEERGPLEPGEIVEALGIDRNVIYQRVFRLRKQRRVERTKSGRIRLRLPRSRNQ